MTDNRTSIVPTTIPKGVPHQILSCFAPLAVQWPTMALQIHLFGTPQCTQESQPVAIQRRKAIALLAYLAVTAQPHSRDALATLLWPEYDQSGARANLRRDLSYLKQALGDERLRITRTDVSLVPKSGWELDIAEFTIRLGQVQAHDHASFPFCPTCWEILTQAVDLYTGDFMAGFSLLDCPEFDEWQFFQREGLRRSLATALQQLIDWSIVQETFDQGIENGRRWLALDPLHEPAHRQLMQLYAWDGQYNAALRQYEECLRLLDEELGVTPKTKQNPFMKPSKPGNCHHPHPPAGRSHLRPPSPILCSATGKMNCWPLVAMVKSTVVWMR